MVGCHAAQSAPGAFPSLWPIPSDADVLVVCTLLYSLIGCRRGIVRVTLLLPGLVAGVPRTGSVLAAWPCSFCARTCCCRD